MNEAIRAAIKQGTTAIKITSIQHSQTWLPTMTPAQIPATVLTTSGSASLHISLHNTQSILGNADTKLNTEHTTYSNAVLCHGCHTHKYRNEHKTPNTLTHTRTSHRMHVLSTSNCNKTLTTVLLAAKITQYSDFNQTARYQQLQSQQNSHHDSTCSKNFERSTQQSFKGSHTNALEPSLNNQLHLALIP